MVWLPTWKKTLRNHIRNSVASNTKFLHVICMSYTWMSCKVQYYILYMCHVCHIWKTLEKLLKVAPFKSFSYKGKKRIMYKPSTNHICNVWGKYMATCPFLTCSIYVFSLQIYDIYIIFIYDFIYVFYVCMHLLYKKHMFF